MLEWLWDVVTGPVLEKLGYTATPNTPAVDGRWPRVWWIPTGALTVLPLHAAGHHDDPSGSRRAVLDRVVSSYTPSVRALGNARSVAHRTGNGGFAVGINDIPDRLDLHLERAEPEAAAIAARLQIQPLLGPDATRQAVLSGLPGAAWAHFSCHGLANQDDPSRSYLALVDGPLYAAELFNARIEMPYLAYLSACTTAMGAVRLLDENISLAAAFQLAGFPHVIGTLWTINDWVAERLARDLYQLVHPDAATWHSPGLVLHDIVRRYRDRFRDDPDLWASHIHYGP
ncbi:hypothetical protein F4553_005261 [Allocatelliglobosispora scoriae]|uniref:CHAT domain-containing protein n=1 Tax=Allocatelliglobosispora scoriae TaxID=643052 RepID=A0A841BYK6_9ACTN|nr:CHAT domain-containing protein [Allocatelliglobosispora scoriae]MBB5871882.1 hypothetical protein [Allocatelliglobosispora scoriae]